mmetsp:Transcript_17977/g.51482  ORF Transcript_17977/g.51482 Transcript_17977/m.51482 type:complete len:227 (+) Transcript_17977:30-710(+)
MSNEGDKSRSKRKREARSKQRDNALDKEYANITFTKRPSSGRPATPHRQFDSSYEGSETRSADDLLTSPSRECGQVVHRHANGLCVVTAGDLISEACRRSSSSGKASTPVTIKQVDFRVKAAEGQSVGSKRRNRMGKNTKKKGSDKNGDGCDERSSGSVRPSDTLAIVLLSCGTSVDLKCCVLGSLLEINSRLIDHPSLLLSDPLLDGYLAVVMPRGPFPLPTGDK